MSYIVTAEDVKKTTKIELAFSATRLLPPLEEIPDEFFKGNIYTKTAEAIFYGLEFPSCTMEFNFDVTPEEVNGCVRAHLQSFKPKQEHKIAGVGYLISKIATLTPTSD